MRVLSIDLGWRNLAYTEMEVFKDINFKIHEWKIIDLIPEDKDVNINTSSLENLIAMTTTKIHEAVLQWKMYSPDIVYLESQPLGQMARNVKTKTLSHILQCLLIANNLKVEFISPKLKLMGMAAGTYYENKKYAVESTKKLLEDNLIWLNWFESLKAKKDDLADAFLQGYYAGKHELVKDDKKPKKPRAKRAKIQFHNVTENALKIELIEISP